MELLKNSEVLDLRTLKQSLDEKADNVIATISMNGLMTSSDKLKLNSIQENANNYTHPLSHSASMIEQTSEMRFTSDEEINNIMEKIESLKNESGVNTEVERELSILKDQINKLSSKQLEILIYLELSNDSSVDETGYWFDSLSTADNILYISGLTVDTDRQRIKGSSGEVIFKNIEIPFISNGIRYVHELDDNFFESIMDKRIEANTNVIEIEKYSYEFK